MVKGGFVVGQDPPREAGARRGEVTADRAVARACTSTFPSAASTGPVITGSPHASSVSRASNSIQAPPGLCGRRSPSGPCASRRVASCWRRPPRDYRGCTGCTGCSRARLENRLAGTRAFGTNHSRHVTTANDFDRPASPIVPLLGHSAAAVSNPANDLLSSSSSHWRSSGSASKARQISRKADSSVQAEFAASVAGDVFGAGSSRPTSDQVPHEM